MLKANRRNQGSKETREGGFTLLEIVMTAAITAMMAATRTSEAPGEGDDVDMLRIARLVGKAEKRPAAAKKNGDRR